MSTIACLGWGSLVWDSGNLPIEGTWAKDGPLLPVEFARQSDRGRITLVIEPNAKLVHSLWAIMDVVELSVAKEALRVREKTLLKNIGTWSVGAPSPEAIPTLADWAMAR